MHPELLEYIKGSLNVGIPHEEIQKDLLAAGWQEQDVRAAFDHLQTPKSQRPIPSPSTYKPNPILMALSNLVVPGGAHLVLHLYGRFFILWGLLLVSFVLPSIFYYTLMIVLIIDTYLQTRRYKKDPTVFPNKKRSLNILGVITIVIAMVIYGFISTNSFSFSPTVCTYLYAFAPKLQTACHHKVQDHAITKAVDQDEARRNQNQLVDPACEALKNDSTLIADHLYFQNTFSIFCYFKKAVETQDPRYCLASGWSNEDAACLSYLALETGKVDACSLAPSIVHYQDNCRRAFQEKKFTYRQSCENHLPEFPTNIKQRCDVMFGSFFSSLKFK